MEGKVRNFAQQGRKGIWREREDPRLTVSADLSTLADAGPQLANKASAIEDFMTKAQTSTRKSSGFPVTSIDGKLRAVVLYPVALKGTERSQGNERSPRRVIQKQGGEQTGMRGTIYIPVQVRPVYLILWVFWASSRSHGSNLFFDP
jgi:hypothetical protein